MTTLPIKKSNILGLWLFWNTFKKYSHIFDGYLAKKFHKIHYLSTKYISINYIKINKITISIIVYALFVNSILGIYLYYKILSPVSLSQSSSMKSFYDPLLGKPNSTFQKTILGIKTKELIITLSNNNLTPVLSNMFKNKQTGFTVPGSIIMINNDNISVFEYGNSQLAKSEAEAYASQYNKYPERNSVGLTHIYIKDTIIILYSGSKDNIIQYLNATAGKSLT
jgi:hypothetical protein